MFSPLCQVFGGCCTNVWVLDKMITSLKDPKLPNGAAGNSPSVANIVTFAQFLFVSLVSYSANTDFRHGSWKTLYLKRSKVPMISWTILVLMYFSISLLNNWSYSYNINVPMYIVFKSSGTVVTMLVGWLFAGKSYNKLQILSCLVMSVGVIMNTLPKDWHKLAQNLSSSKVDFNFDLKFLIGVLILSSTTFLSAFMGLYNETINKKYGNQWSESLFYTHFLALPLFFFVWPNIESEFSHIWKPTPYQTYSFFPFASQQFVNLLANVVSQYICIRGVNKLIGSNSALTVTIILLLRKVASLIVSVFWFGHELTTDGIIGGSLVLLGAALYSIAGQKDKDTPKTVTTGAHDTLASKKKAVPSQLLSKKNE